jgi:UDP-4-amino-4,6-dideoxy-N-acetyl-beta-L-altrosamine N-acetyltransferase
MTESTSNTLRVRPMRPTDLDCVLDWRNHSDVRRFMFTQEIIALDEHQRWYEKASKDSHKKLYIFENNQLALGFVSFTEVAPGGVVDWGFYTAPQAPKGTGRQLGLTALHHAFSQLNVHKVCGQAIGFNQRSIDFHLGLGFTPEGTLRAQHFDGAHYHDVVCFGLLSVEWQQGKK